MPEASWAKFRSQGSGTLFSTAQRIEKLLFPGGNVLGGLDAANARAQQAADPGTTGNRAIIEPGSDQWLHLSFHGTDAADEAGSFRIWGWRLLPGEPTKASGAAPAIANLWRPRHLIDGTFTLGAATGVDGTHIPSAQFMADTIAITVDNTYNIPSATVVNVTDHLAWMFFDYSGYQKIEVQLSESATAFDVNGTWWTL